MINLGKVKPGSTLRIPFGSFQASNGAPAAVTNYADTDIQVYKDGNTTQRASAAGLTATTTFDTLTGVNLITIDLADNTTASFWNAGSEYIVVVSDITVDGQTLRFPVARFVIGIEGAILDTTIATLASQTSFTLTTGPADNNALIGCGVYVHDLASAVQCAMGTISAYTGSTRTVTLAVDPAIFTMAAGDNISVLPRANVYSLGGVAQAGRDIGTSVLVSSGTSTGQLSVTSGVVSSNPVQLNGSATNLLKLATSASTIIRGTVNNSVFSPTSSIFAADDITEATPDHYVGRNVYWTTGALFGQAARITAYSLVSGEGRFTVTTMTEAPSNNDEFDIT